VTLTIRLVDRFGNVTANDFTATVDNDRPTGVFRPSGTYLRGTFTAWPYDLRDNVYVRSMASYLDDHKGGGTTDRYPLSVRVNSRAVKDGKHVLAFELTDLAGNVGTVRRTVYIDNTVPAIALTKAPKNKAKLTKKVTLKATASDRYGVAKVQLLVDGKVVATDAKAGYQFTLNPKKYGRKFTVQMRAYDRAGNARYSAKRTYTR
jgi:Bacterial Ig domain/Bacterial Ig-like domain